MNKSLEKVIYHYDALHLTAVLILLQTVGSKESKMDGLFSGQMVYQCLRATAEQCIILSVNSKGIAIELDFAKVHHIVGAVDEHVHLLLSVGCLYYP